MTGVGTFFHAITLVGPNGRSETLEAMVDTGAMFTVVPALILERLGVRPFRTMPVRFANGETQQRQLGQIEAELLGNRMPILVFFGSPNTPALIGAHTLEAFLLTVDVVEKRLVPKEALLMGSGSG
jgi:predicted aspartyl protease